MNSGKKIVVAMSGGVDSSVTAALLAREGFDVVGVTLRLFREQGPDGARCCGSSSSVDKARRVCDRLGIRHYYKNAEDIFNRSVIENFIESYAAGLTPNPCVECNRHLKFSYLFSLAEGMGAEFLATGHYARITGDEQGQMRLKRGIDKGKDQSYFLYCLKRGTLPRIIFPLGEMTKPAVRALAGELGIPAALDAESQDICFVPSGRYADFVEAGCRQNGLDAGGGGNIVNSRGEVLGRHEGVFRFTVGQRQGIGIQGPGPYYVISIEPSTRTVVVGGKKETMSEGCVVSGINWISSGVQADAGSAQVQIRYRHKPVPALLSEGQGNNMRVRFETPQFAVSPGQSAVFYRGDEVLGGGIIASAICSGVSPEV